MPQNSGVTWMCALEIEVNQLYKLNIKVIEAIVIT